jgi:hypothetical protein
MKRNDNGGLSVWKPTGNYVLKYNNVPYANLYAVWMVLSNPIFLIAVAVIDVAVMIYFNLATVWWMGAVAPSAALMAIVAFVFRRKKRYGIYISERQARRCNTSVDALQCLPRRYQDKIELRNTQSQADEKFDIELYRALGQVVIDFGLYDETSEVKINKFTGDESIKINLIRFYVTVFLDSGYGYFLLEPPARLIEKTSRIDARVISRVLRDVGRIEWVVERVSFDKDDVTLFVLKDSAMSQAFDFCGTD